MKLFIDASVALAAAGQAGGASRAIFDAASKQGWELQVSNYVLREVAAICFDCLLEPTKIGKACGLSWLSFLI